MNKIFPHASSSPQASSPHSSSSNVENDFSAKVLNSLIGSNKSNDKPMRKSGIESDDKLGSIVKDRVASISHFKRRTSVEEAMDKITNLEETQKTLVTKSHFSLEEKNNLKNATDNAVSTNFQKNRYINKKTIQKQSYFGDFNKEEDPADQIAATPNKSPMLLPTSSEEEIEAIGVEESEEVTQSVIEQPNLRASRASIMVSKLVMSKSNASSNILSSEEIEMRKKIHALKQLTSLVPRRIVLRAIDMAETESLEEPKIVPFAEEYDAAVLFADISGFSALAEKLAKSLNDNVHAAEDLSSYVGACLEQMVKMICDQGGDVVKFAGDAILAIYPVSLFDDKLIDATHCCAQVALNLLKLELKAGTATLSVHCGVGCGTLCGYNVGGYNGMNRWEYVITGDPISQIGSAEPEAEAGQVVISKKAHEMLSALAEGKKLPSENFLLTGLTKLVYKTQASLHETIDSLYYENAICVHDMIGGYVPFPARKVIEGGSKDFWIAELRVVNILFVRVKGLKYNGVGDLDEVLLTMQGIQQMIYRYEGTLCRFIVDDKGSGLLIAFGLPPAKHENDPLRAVKAAIAVTKKMEELKHSASIGVTLGNVFCGTVGGSIRCEYTLHGTNVNLAARLMVSAGEGVLVDEETYNETKSRIAYGDKKMITVKGKIEPFAVYRPLNSKFSHQAHVRGKEVSLFGRDKELKAINSAFNGFLNENTSHHGTALFFLGSMGIGKSRLCNFINSIAETKEVKLLQGSCSDTEKHLPYFAWRGIFAQLCNFEECLTNEDKISNMKSLLSAEDSETVLHFVEKIFPDICNIVESYTKQTVILNVEADSKGINILVRDAIQKTVNSYIDNNKGKKKNTKLERKQSRADLREMALSTNARTRKANTKMSLNKEAMKKKNNVGVAKKASEFVISKAKLATHSSAGGGKEMGGSVTEDLPTPTQGNINTVGGCFKRLALLFDDVHSMDNLSWDALLFVIDECENILTFATLRRLEGSRYIEQLKFTSEHSKSIKLFELAPLSKSDVELMLKELILTEKDPDASQLDTYWKIHSLSENVTDYVHQISEGLPLYTEELCRTVIGSGNLLETNNTWYLSDKAVSGAYKLPDSVSAIMTSKIDKLTNNQKMLLMVGSVIGISFPKNVLYAVFPVSYDIESFQEDLVALVSMGFVMRDGSNFRGDNVSYIFKQKLMHKTAYELLIFKKRRDLHLKIAEYYESVGKENIPNVQTVLAHHYYHAEKFESAVNNLIESGNLAFKNNDIQQVVSCYSKLLEIQEQYVKHISYVDRISWKRKLAFASLIQGNLTQSREYIKDALLVLGHPIPEGWFNNMIRNFYLKLRLNKTANKKLSEEQRLSLLETARCYEVAEQLSENFKASFSACLHSLIFSAEAAPSSPELARAQSKMCLGYLRVKEHKKAYMMCLQSLSTLGATTGNASHQKTNAIVKRDLSIFNIAFSQFQVAENLLSEAQWVCECIRISEYLSSVTLLQGLLLRFQGKISSLEPLASRAASKDGDVEVWRFRAEMLLLYVKGGNTVAANSTTRAMTSLQKSARYQMHFNELSPEEVTNALPQRFTCLGVWSMIVLKKGNNFVIALQIAIKAIEIARKTVWKLSILDFHSLSLLAQVILKLLGVDSIRAFKRTEKDPLVEQSDQETAKVYLKIIVEILDSIASIYPVCLPEYKWIVGMMWMVEDNLKKATATLAEGYKLAIDLKTSYVVGLILHQQAHLLIKEEAILAKLDLANHIFKECDSIVDVKLVTNEIKILGGKILEDPDDDEEDKKSVKISLRSTNVDEASSVVLSSSSPKDDEMSSPVSSIMKRDTES